MLALLRGVYDVHGYLIEIREIRVIASYSDFLTSDQLEDVYYYDRAASTQKSELKILKSNFGEGHDYFGHLRFF